MLWIRSLDWFGGTWCLSFPCRRVLLTCDVLSSLRVASSCPKNRIPLNTGAPSSPWPVTCAGCHGSWLGPVPLLPCGDRHRSICHLSFPVFARTSRQAAWQGQSLLLGWSVLSFPAFLFPAFYTVCCLTPKVQSCFREMALWVLTSIVNLICLPVCHRASLKSMCLCQSG